MSDIYTKIKEHEEISKDLLEINDVERDGNCFYRTLSLYFTNDEMHFSFFREQIYSAAKNNMIELKEFFIEDKNNPILENTNKLKVYIEQIKENTFFAGVVGIYIASKIINIIIAVYGHFNLTLILRHIPIFFQIHQLMNI